MPSSAGPDIIQNGLVLALDASDRNSYPTTGTSWFDLSGNGNTGTLTNGPTFNSGNGGSIVCDGSNDYISSLVLNSTPFSNITIQLWIYPTNIGSGNGYITVFDTANRQLSLWIGNQYYGLGGGTGGFYSGTFNWQNNTWCCITMFKLGSSGQIIKNNYEVSVNIGIGGSTFTNQLEFGSNPSGGGTPFAGRYGNIKIYNRALSASEILQNYNATRTKFGL